MTYECPKCRTRMEEGFIVDEDHAQRHASSWIEGAPEKGLLGSVKTGKRRKLEIATYRCTRCGYLESYAR